MYSNHHMFLTHSGFKHTANNNSTNSLSLYYLSEKFIYVSPLLSSQNKSLSPNKEIVWLIFLHWNTPNSLLRRTAHSAHGGNIWFINHCLHHIRPQSLSSVLLSSTIPKSCYSPLFRYISWISRGFSRQSSVLSSLFWLLYFFGPDSSAFMYFWATFWSPWKIPLLKCNLFIFHSSCFHTEAV